jgi:hypothetical protein
VDAHAQENPEVAGEQEGGQAADLPSLGHSLNLLEMLENEDISRQVSSSPHVGQAVSSPSLENIRCSKTSPQWLHLNS